MSDSMRWCNFVGGPRDGEHEDCMSAVPSRRIPVYAPPPSGAVCADEQVITLLGHYVRAEHSHIGWYYDWIEAP